MSIPILIHLLCGSLVVLPLLVRVMRAHRLLTGELPGIDDKAEFARRALDACHCPPVTIVHDEATGDLRYRPLRRQLEIPQTASATVYDVASLIRLLGHIGLQARHPWLALGLPAMRRLAFIAGVVSPVVFALAFQQWWLAVGDAAQRDAAGWMIVGGVGGMVNLALGTVLRSGDLLLARLGLDLAPATLDASVRDRIWEGLLFHAEAYAVGPAWLLQVILPAPPSTAQEASDV